VEWISNPEIWIALATLTVLEIVLGIDNIIFISILAGKLPQDRQARARTIGLGMAMLTRIGLLFSLTWILRLTAPLFLLLGQEISGRDVILIAGGLFLIAKSTRELHLKLEGEEGHASRAARASLTGIVIQIALLDIIFSMDSVITAVGMTNHLGVMVTAVIIAVICMMIFSGYLNDFVHRHPTIKVLALSFLLLIGVTLIADGFDQHISKGYIYFAMAFSVFVEILNLQVRKRESAPVHLRESYTNRPSSM
jgi:predicted tellurium resistance membrane protein TerC